MAAMPVAWQANRGHGRSRKRGDRRACPATPTGQPANRLDIPSTPGAYARAMRIPARFQPLVERLRQSLPVALARRFSEADLLTHAAALSFYTLLSLAPLLVLLLWLVATAPATSPAP